MGVLMRKKLLSLLLAVSVLFSVFSVTAAAAGEETEIFTLPETLGDELRVDNERNEIYFVPQFFNVEDLFALLMEADPTLDFDIDAGSLKNGMYLVSGVTVTVYQGDPNVNRVYTVRVKGDLSGEGRTTANEARQALRLSVGLDEDLFESCFRALDADGNDRITADDARTLLRVSVALESFGDDPDAPGLLGALEGVAYYPERSIPLLYDTLAEELNSAVLTPKDTVEVKHLRDTVDMYWDVEITDQDKAVIERLFSALPKNATNLEKIYAAYKYIQMNYSYARGWDLYSQIWDKTPVDAVFNYHLAQCLQYNGAIAEVLACMGYDVKIVEGMRGMAFNEDGVSEDYWNHYWMELYLNGNTYLIEVGQPEDYWYGSFMVFYADSFSPYSTSRYVYYDEEKEGYCALT